MINNGNYIDYDNRITDEEIRDLDPDQGKCIVKRLIHLYPKKYRFSFFPSSGIPGMRLNEENGTVCSK